MADSQRPHPGRSDAIELSRASRELLAAAEREASDIVAAARAEVHRTVLKAQHQLLGLSAQVETTIELLDGRETSPFFPGVTGRRAASHLLRDARAGLDALSAEPRVIDDWGTDARVGEAPLSAPGLSQFEMESFRLPPLPPRLRTARRVRLPARAAARAAAVVLVGAIAVALVGAWALGKRSADSNVAGEVKPHVIASGSAAAPREEREENEPTGMIGRGDFVSKPPADRPGSSPMDEPRVEPSGRPSPPAAATRPSGAEAAATSTTPPAVRQELISAAERWLDAYYLQDAGRMGALSTTSMTISDERKPEERLPAGLTSVRRSLSDPNVQVFGTDAIITAKVTERVEGPGGHTSAGFISQMWTRRAGVWQVTDVRIVSAAAVERAFKR